MYSDLLAEEMVGEAALMADERPDYARLLEFQARAYVNVMERLDRIEAVKHFDTVVGPRGRRGLSAIHDITEE